MESPKAPGGGIGTAPSHSSSSSRALPYHGDLDAARKARDTQAVRILTQKRDRDTKLGLGSPVSSGARSNPLLSSSIKRPSGEPFQAPAASGGGSVSSLTRRLMEMGFSIHQAESATLPPNLNGLVSASEALSYLSQAAADGGSNHLLLPTPPPSKRTSPPAHPSTIKASAPPIRSASSLFASPLASPSNNGGGGGFGIGIGGSHQKSPLSTRYASGAGETAGSPGAGLSNQNQTSHFFNHQLEGGSAGEEEEKDLTACCLLGHHHHHHLPHAAQEDHCGGDLLRREGAVGSGGGGAASAGQFHLPFTHHQLAAHHLEGRDGSVCACCGGGRGPVSGAGDLVVGGMIERSWIGSITQEEAAIIEGEQAATEGDSGEVEIEDPILLAKLPISLMYMVDCRCSHWFGVETLYCGIKAALNDDLIPACPLANHPDESQRCNYLLTQREVEHVLNRYKPPSQLPLEERRLWRFMRGRLVDGCYGWLSERVSEAFLRKGKIAAGCMECPNGRCGYWVEPARPLEKQRVDCPKCLIAFCTLCKRPYHFRCSCDEVMTITKQWLEWQQHGREPYLRKMAQEDSSYQNALDTFNSRRSAHNQEVRTAEQNWDLLVADENYKASRCRRCPHCNRVIERIDGCDTMICGQNAHGGNIQNGCGQGFNWNEAIYYHADIGKKKSIIPFQEIPPPEISRIMHQIMDGQPIKCDICSSKIQGPLAMCINCPIFNCCIRCQNKHTRGHVLRLYMDNSYR